MALREGYLPPTIHYREPDPDCALDVIPNTGRASGACAAVPGAHLGSEPGLPDAAEQGDLALVLRLGEYRHRPHLGQGLQDEHPRHHMVLGEVAFPARNIRV